MKKKILLIFFLFTGISAFAQYEVKGGSGTPLLAETSGVMYVYLVNGLQDAQISYTSATSETHQWYRYKTNANESEEIPSQQTENTSVITGLNDGYGYFVGTTNDPSTRYVWIIDYSQYFPTFNSLSIREDEFKCERIILLADINAPKLPYFTSAGAYKELERTYRLQYTTMEWQKSDQAFISQDIDKQIKMTHEININPAPLQNTDFTLTGDTYSEHFGKPQTLKTPVYEAISVNAQITVEWTKDGHTNELPNTAGDGRVDLDTSAPVDITFTAYANEPVAAFYVWTIYDMIKNQSIVRYTDKVLRYTFEKDGTYKVQLEVSDRQSVCVDSSQVFNIIIEPSDLKIPNAFSPGSTPGVNDEFKVAYRSILKFKCTIFNRWGTKLYEWDDPSKGWDGRVNGKLVPTGAYFYVIQYTGTDNKSHTRKGAVNILRGQQ